MGTRPARSSSSPRYQKVDSSVRTRFEVLGRAKGAQIRGRGDTLTETVYQTRV